MTIRLRLNIPNENLDENFINFDQSIFKILKTINTKEKKKITAAIDKSRAYIRTISMCGHNLTVLW